MKRRFVFYVMSALALVGFNSCEKEINPNYNPETQEVVTNFVFNVPGANKVTTRMSNAATQAYNGMSFRGINNAVLLSYAKDGNNGKILAADETATKINDLSTVVAPNVLSPTNSRRVLEMSLPLKTNTLLFYGIAPQGEAYQTSTNPFYTVNDCYGKMASFSIGQDAGSTDISLQKRISGDNKTKFETTEKLFSGIMSCIMNTNLIGDNKESATADEHPTGVTNTYKFNLPATGEGAYPDTISWRSFSWGKSVSSDAAHDWYPLEEKLGKAYVQMTKINNADGELRAADGESLKRTVKDLWTIVNEVRCADPLNKEEALAKFLAHKISIEMAKYFTPEELPTDGSPVGEISFNDVTTIKTNFTAPDPYRPYATYYNGAESKDWPTATEIADLTNLDDFPFNYSLPRGAVHMAYKGTPNNTFYYPATFNTSGMGVTPGSGSYNAESYYYPAELMYFGNSPVRTTDTDKKVSDYPNGVGSGDKPWDDEASWTGWDGNFVKASTRAVAMKYNINYGTALLETHVKYATTDLKDNNHAVQAYNLGVATDDPSVADELDKTISVDGTSFQLTGIIIGGQSEKVDWDFLPTGTTRGFIYDKAIPDSAKVIPVSGSSKANYTMVLDNFKSAGKISGIHTPDTQETVYVALEFQNKTGKDFYGNFNLIRDEGYFYLIGALDPAQYNGTDKPNGASNYDSFTFPARDGYVLPPYTAAGASQNVKRVFAQDLVTKVTFALGENSLKYAYLTVPDLRSGSITLGLSVDLKWESGLVFDDIILGGN